jgi:hypothetical protein
MKFAVNPAGGQLVDQPIKDSSKIIVRFIQSHHSLKGY